MQKVPTKKQKERVNEGDREKITTNFVKMNDFPELIIDIEL